MTHRPAQSIPIILLAAGQSARMRGRDKLMEDVDGAPLIRRQADMALEVSKTVCVALPPPPHPRHDALDGCNVQRVVVPDAALGMTHSLKAAFAALPAGTPAAMLLLADLPDLTADDLRTVLSAVDPDSETLIWRGTTEDGAPGHPIVFAAPLFGAFQSLSGDGGGHEVVAAAGDRVHLVTLPGTRARNDLDTPEDWAAWRAAQRN